jgi:hypothetical protein
MTEKALPKTRLARARAYARLGAYLFFALLVVAVLALRSARASAQEAELALGRELAEMGDLAGDKNRLVINGQTMFVATAGSDASVGQVLDRFEGLCSEHAASMAEEIARLPEASRVLVTKGVSSRGLGILRKETDQEGTVACFADDEGGGAAGILARTKAFLATLDLSKLGRLRYVYATKTAHGSHVVSVWAEGPVKLGEMFPREGDASGSDSDLAPRPRDARRLLTAQVTGAPYAVRVYDTRLSRETYLAETMEAMDRAGWVHVTPPSGGDARGFLRGDGVEVVVTTAPEEDRTLVTIVEMGRGAP